MKNITYLKSTPGKRFRHSLLALASFGFGLTSVAQTTFTIGTGTGTVSNAPLTTNYGYNFTEQIYYASELTAQGASPGYINKIRFFNTSSAPANNQDWVIYMGHTNETDFSSNTDWIPVAALTEVFNGTVAFSSNGWMEITLATPFEWNGVSNVVIAIDENTNNWGNLCYWQSTSSGVNRSIYYRNDSTNPDPASPPSATGRLTAFPNLQIDWAPAPDCAGTPAHAAANATADSICPNQSVTLSIDQIYFASQITYQWQADAGTGWTDLAGTNATFTTALTETTDFRCIVGCAATGDADTSDIITVVVNPNPVVAIDYTDIAICGGEPANLTASGAATYLWSPTTLLTPSATAASVNVIPASTTTYTVTGTSAYGCTATATAKVTPVTQVLPKAVYTPAENCTSGTPVTIEVVDLPAAITSGGTWEYRFLGPDTVTVLQDWSSDATFTFTPPADGIYEHFFQVRSTSCPDNYIDSMSTSIAIGFGAEVDLTHYNCSTMGGTIALSEQFGQVTTEELYANSFDDAGNMPGVTLSGTAAITSNRLQLTSNTGQSGYAVIDIPGFTPGLNNSMTVSFNMTADQPINNYGTGGADGIAYSFGNDATPAGNGTGHNGKGTKLRLSFDAAGNSGENNNQVGIYLVYGWTAGNAFGPNSAQTRYYTANTSLWKLKTDVPVVFAINAEGKASLTVDGTVVFSGVQLPQEYMNADVSGWKHLFSAATGGDALRQAVSNVQITKSDLNFGITPGNSTTPPTEWQTSTSFGDLLPGEYDIWISRDSAGTCLKNIGTYEILNLNPVVDLGNDTTICEGESVILDAGNPGSVYTWSGSNAYTQTLEVTEEGSYLVYVTDTAGCLGIGTINVDVNEAPTAAAIYAQGNFPTVSFSVTGADNVDTYDWNFGDGVTVNNGPASITHTYATDGTFNVTVTVSNDCGTETISESITITDVTGIGENLIEGLEVYPNPAAEKVTVSVPNNETSTISVYNTAGALVLSNADFSATTTVDVSTWQKGIYFLHISNQGKVSVTKLVVQ